MKKEYIKPALSLFNARIDYKNTCEENDKLAEQVLNHVASAFIENEIVAELECVKFYYNVTQFVFKIIEDSSYGLSLERKLDNIAGSCRAINDDICVDADLTDKGTERQRARISYFHFYKREPQAIDLLKNGGFVDGKVCLYFDPECVPVYEPIESLYVTTISSLGDNCIYLLKSILANLTYSIPPNMLNTVIFDSKNELVDFDKAPHNLFCRVIDDFNLFYPALEWLDGEVERRLKLLKEGNFNNISAYNAINAQKMPYIAFVVSGFMAVFKEYGIYSERVINKLISILDKAKEVGILFLFSAPTNILDPYHNGIRARATKAICFAMNSAEDSHNAMGHAIKLGKLLVDKTAILVKQNNNMDEMLPCFFADSELEKLFIHFKKQPLGFDEGAFKQMLARSQEGEMSRASRKANEEYLIEKEFLRYLIRHAPKGSSLEHISRFLRVERKLGSLVMQKLLEKDYVQKIENKIFTLITVSYKSNVTKEQFKELFGEEV